MKIVVLAGGLSPERDVSLSSGSLIANALREAGHRVLLLDVYEGIHADESDFEYLFEDITGRRCSYTVPDVEPDLAAIKRRNNNGDALVGPNVLRLCQFADVVFVGLHGAMGENGQIQATFDVMGVTYTGTGYVGSLLAMDKDLTKKLLRQAQLPTAEWMILSDTTSLDSVQDKIGFPCVVKPCGAGSSIGVSIVHDQVELQSAISYARKVEERILVEKMISGREFSVGILDGVALPIIEITPRQGFYDYKNKYQVGLTEETCPANLSEHDAQRLQDLARKIHTLLRLGTYSRIDFILDQDGEFICLEANTLPGMTPTSLLPQEALASGISYVQLCNRLVQLAMK